MRRLFENFAKIVDETLGPIKITKQAAWRIVCLSYLIEVCLILSVFSVHEQETDKRSLTASFDE